MTSASGAWSRRDLIVPVVLPTSLESLGRWAFIPVIPVLATNLGADLSTAAIIVGLLVMGSFAGTIPAGWAASRFGERRALLAATVVLVLGASIAWAATSLAVLATGLCATGFAGAMFTLSRQAYLTVGVPVRVRGRAFSLVAGASRLGAMAGPFVGAAAILVTGNPRTALIASTFAFAVTWVLIYLGFRDETTALSTPGEAGAPVEVERTSIRRTVLRRRDVLARLGPCAALLSMMGTTRTLVIPLLAVYLGLSETSIALLVGLCGVVDLSLFYVGGSILDQFGRLWASVPSMLLYASSYVALALSLTLSDSVEWFVICALVMSVASGIVPGVVGTMGADLADPVDPAPFLSSWRLVSAIGPLSAPFLISAISGLGSVEAVPLAMGGLALLGAVMLMVYVPRYLPRVTLRK